MIFEVTSELGDNLGILRNLNGYFLLNPIQIA